MHIIKLKKKLGINLKLVDGKKIDMKAVDEDVSEKINR